MAQLVARTAGGREAAGSSPVIPTKVEIMKLYLSSLGIPDEQAYRALLPGGTPKVAIIANGWDVYPYEKSAPYIQACAQALHKLDCQTEFIDLAQYKMKVDIESKLKEFDVVYVTGGNVFYLKRLMVQSGFWGCVKNLVEDGLVYSGESAGAVIAGQAFDGAEFVDDKEAAPEVDGEGLGLVDFGIVPHWGRDKYKDVQEKFRAELSKHGEVKTLADTQAIVVDGQSVKVIG